MGVGRRFGARDLALVRQVSEQRLLGDIRHLSTAWPTRHTFSRHHKAQADWLADRMRGIGCECRLERWTVGSPATGQPKADSGLNVVATLASPRAKSTTVVCAHFDSRQQDLGNPEAPAPGAGDNASGVAAVLECARILSRHSEPARDHLRFVFFSGEEQGLLGSRWHADQPANRRNIRFVLNLDQIGFPPTDRAVNVDRDNAGNPSNNGASQRLVDRIRALASEIGGIPTRVAPAEGSDYLSFERHGIPITGLYEAGKDYPHYHRDTDTWDRVDIAYVASMTRLALATVLDQAREA